MKDATQDDLPVLYDLVYTILEMYPETRDCNFALFHYFYKHYYNMTDTEILKDKAVYLPKPNSVERAARIVQKDGYFLPSRYVENCRSLKEESIRMFCGRLGSGSGSVRANYKDRSFKMERGDMMEVKHRVIKYRNKWLKKASKEAEIEFRRILNDQATDEIPQ